MDCHEAEVSMQAYIDGSLDDVTCSDFLAHIASCERCKEELETYYTIDYALRYMDDPNAGDEVFDFRKGMEEDIALVSQRIVSRNALSFLQRLFLSIAELVLIIALASVVFPELALFLQRLLRALFSMS